MSVAEIIDRVFPKVKSVDPPLSRRSGSRSILKLIEQGQDALLLDVQSRNIFYDETNQGFPPYLKTVVGTYSYEISGANLSCGTPRVIIGGQSRDVKAHEVLRIFQDAGNVSEYNSNNRYLGEPYSNYRLNPMSSNIDRSWVASEPVDCYPALENDYPKVMFKQDPGTEESKWFVEFTWRAPRLISESIPLIVPVDFEPVLERYAVASALGDLNFLFEFKNTWVPECQKIMSRGAKARDTRVKRRLC